MSKRDEDPRLQEIFRSGAEVYSYSKLSMIDECPYSAYLRYIKGQQGIHNIYDICGSLVHDTLENMIHGEATEADLRPALEKELEELNMLGIDFPRDRRGGTAIRDKWISNMMLFCDQFEKPRGTYETEKLIILKLSDTRYLQGYADLIRLYKDGSVQVLDWKTSSQFQNKDLLHYGRQLVAYTLALKQEGYRVRDPAWIMLKYIQVIWTGKIHPNSKKETSISKVCDRCKLYDTIQVAVYDKLASIDTPPDEIERVLQALQITNSLESLPESIRDQFTVRTYVRPYRLTDEIEQECLDFINRTADSFMRMKETDSWPSIEIMPKNEFKCLYLCNYRNTCPALQEYKDRKRFKDSSDDEMF